MSDDVAKNEAGKHWSVKDSNKWLEFHKKYEEEIEQLKKNDKNIRFYRYEALKLATDIAFKIDHFKHRYEGGLEELIKDLNLVYEIADSNLQYIMGEK